LAQTSKHLADFTIYVTLLQNYTCTAFVVSRKSLRHVSTHVFRLLQHSWFLTCMSFRYNGPVTTLLKLNF